LARAVIALDTANHSIQLILFNRILGALPVVTSGATVDVTAKMIVAFGSNVWSNRIWDHDEQHAAKLSLVVPNVDLPKSAAQLFPDEIVAQWCDSRSAKT
jgi:hypothetical protein